MTDPFVQQENMKKEKKVGLSEFLSPKNEN